MGTQSVDIVPPRWLDAVGSGMQEQRRWFAVYTRSHHEKRVAQHYAERNIEHLLPVTKVKRQWSHYRKVTLELPLFPNYLFVHIYRRERVRAMEVPGALSLVGQSSHPTPLPDIEIESLRDELNMQNVTPHPYMAVGAKVRINKGVLCGREGIVLFTKNGCRVVLTLSLIMRSFAVEVDATDVDFIT
jgi:transcription antitermination factor NusG